VVGVDASSAMLDEARAAYPELTFQLGRAEELTFVDAFDAIFSNATLHWVPRAADAARATHRALRPGGRLAAEFGGFQNIAAVRAAVGAGLRAIGRADADWNPWYFPRLGAYAAVLENAGFTVRFAQWFPRPSPMPDKGAQSGIAGWLSIFASALCESLTVDERPAFFEAVERQARGALYRDGVWWIDYVRLRVEAVKPG
jgi:SAM-dependent methyltransferase